MLFTIISRADYVIRECFPQTIIMDEDYILALQLQEQFNQEANSGPQNVTFDTPVQPVSVPAERESVGDENLLLGQWIPKKEESSQSEGSEKWSVVDPRWDMIDPLPDARALFIEFNSRYFGGKLAGVEVRWSPRMTL